MSDYLRLRSDIVSDHRIQNLDPHAFKAFINVLCVDNKYPDSSVSDADMAWRLRIDANEWTRVKAVLVRADLISSDNKPTYDGVVLDLRPTPAEWRVIRERIFARDDYTCRYCGTRGVALECDHVIPVSRAGSNDDDNLVTACKPCNRAKRDKIVSIAEWSAKRRAVS